MESLKIKGMIFDLDGTLGDTIPVCFAAFRYAVEGRLGRQFTDQEIVDLFGPSELGIVKKLLPDSWKEAMRDYRKEYLRAHANCVEPYLGIKELLELLTEKGIKLAIVTGKGEESCWVSIDHMEIGKYFDIVIAGSPGGPIKPDAICSIVNQWGIEPSEAAYVGDAGGDMDAAREVGVFPVGAGWGDIADRQELIDHGAGEVFDSVDAFVDWVRSEGLS